MTLTEGKPLARRIVVSEQRDTGRALACSKVHRSAVVTDERVAATEHSCRRSGHELSAEIDGRPRPTPRDSLGERPLVWRAYEHQGRGACPRGERIHERGPVLLAPVLRCDLRPGRYGEHRPPLRQTREALDRRAALIDRQAQIPVGWRKVHGNRRPQSARKTYRLVLPLARQRVDGAHPSPHARRGTEDLADTCGPKEKQIAVHGKCRRPRREIDERLGSKAPQLSGDRQAMTPLSRSDREIQRLIDQPGTLENRLDAGSRRRLDGVGEQDAAMLGKRARDRVEARQRDNRVADAPDAKNDETGRYLSAHSPDSMARRSDTQVNGTTGLTSAIIRAHERHHRTAAGRVIGAFAQNVRTARSMPAAAAARVQSALVRRAASPMASSVCGSHMSARRTAPVS